MLSRAPSLPGWSMVLLLPILGYECPSTSGAPRATVHDLSRLQGPALADQVAPLDGEDAERAFRAVGVGAAFVVVGAAADASLADLARGAVDGHGAVPAHVA